MEDLPAFDRNLRLVLAVPGTEVGRRVIIEVRRDHDPEKKEMRGISARYVQSPMTLP